MRSGLRGKSVGIAVVVLFSLPAVDLRSVEDAPTACSAAKRYCYEPPVHLDSPVNTPGFEGKPSLSADGLELYFVSDRPGALGGPGDQDIYVSRRSSVNRGWGPPERNRSNGPLFEPPAVLAAARTGWIQCVGWLFSRRRARAIAGPGEPRTLSCLHT